MTDPELTEQDIDFAAAQVRQALDDYMLSADFEVRADAACTAIQAGGLRTNEELAEALGLPERFLAVVLQAHAEKIFAHHGGLQ